MKQLVWLAPIFISSVLVLPACDRNRDDRTPTSQPAPGTAAKKMSDSDLENLIRAQLESDDAVKKANLSVKVDVGDNNATLSGTVMSQELRTKAVELAKTAQPGLTIKDEIEVKPAG